LKSLSLLLPKWDDQKHLGIECPLGGFMGLLTAYEFAKKNLKPKGTSISTMKPIIAKFTGSLLACLPLSGETIKITVNEDATTHPISRYLYGQFIEHLGGCIYDGIWVGEDSDIPNERGIRLDTVDALKKLNIPVMRWPGGLFADTYHWRDGIGPREQRPITLNRGWNATESNQFGTHEFMALCELIGTEPYLCINIGSGTVEEARSWAEYCNGTMDTTITRERAKNGHPEPFNVKFWSLGNEPYYALDGNMTSQYYYERARHFAPYVKFTAANVTLATEPGYDDVRIFLADGRVVEEVEVRDRDVPHFDMLAVHDYTGRSADISKDDHDTLYNLMLSNLPKLRSKIDHVSGLAKGLSTDKHKISVALDEWGVWRTEALPTTGLVQDVFWGDCVYSAALLQMLHEFDNLAMANLAQTCNVLSCLIKTDGEKFYRTPLYHVFEMFVPFMDSMGLQVSVAGTPELQTEDRAVSEQVSISAARTKDGNLFISLVNMSPDNSATIALDSGKERKVLRTRQLTAAKVDAVNSFLKPDNIHPVELSGVDMSSLTLSPLSVTTIELK